MDWNSVKMILAIATQGSLLGAAKQLDVNHSTIFRRLNSFEKSIGGRLFERTNNGYELTPMGEEFANIANKIAASFDDMERQIIGKDIQPKGTVKITAPPNIAYRYLPRYLSTFHQHYPEIRIEILASNLEFNMTNRQADIAIRATSTPPEYLIGRKLEQIQWSVYASKTYIKNYGSPKNIEQLQQHSIIGATKTMLHLPAFIWLDKYLPNNIYTRCDDMVTMSYFAEAGHALAILPDDQCRSNIKKLFIFEPGESSMLWLLTHPDLRNVVRIKLVIKHLVDSFAADKLT